MSEITLHPPMSVILGNALSGSDHGFMPFIPCLIYLGIFLNYIAFMQLVKGRVGDLKIVLAMQGAGVVQPHCNLSLSVHHRELRELPPPAFHFSSPTHPLSRPRPLD